MHSTSTDLAETHWPIPPPAEQRLPSIDAAVSPASPACCAT